MNRSNLPLAVTAYPWPAQAVEISKSDSVDLSVPVDGLYLTTGGNLKITTNGTAVTYTGLPVGFLNVSATRVWSSGTTASLFGLVAIESPGSGDWFTTPPASITTWGSTFDPSDADLSFVRSIQGDWRVICDIRSQFPAGWDDTSGTSVWQTIYCDPLRGSDNSSNSGASPDPTAIATNAGPIRSLYRALTMSLSTGMTKRRILVPDNAKFWTGKLGSLQIGRAWSAGSNKGIPGSSTIIMPYSVWENGGIGDATWTSSTEWMVDPAYPWTQVDISDVPDTSSIVWLARLISGTTDQPVPNFNAAIGSESGFVFDFNSLDSEGTPQRYIKLASKAAVFSTPYSYYGESTGQKVWINNPTPDCAGVQVYAASLPNGYTDYKDKEIAVVNCIFEGGQIGFQAKDTASSGRGGLILRMFNCQYLYTAGGQQGFSVESNPESGKSVEIRSFGCLSAANGNDGFSYYADVKFLEVDCVSHSNGKITNVSSGVKGYVNGFTSHEKAVGIRVNCEAFANYGANIADARTSYYCSVLSLGCYSYDSNNLDSRGHGCTDYAVVGQSSGTGIAKGWWIDGKFYNRDFRASKSKRNIYVEGPNATLYYNNALPNRVSQSGTVTLSLIYVAFPGT